MNSTLPKTEYSLDCRCNGIYRCALHFVPALVFPFPKLVNATGLMNQLYKITNDKQFSKLLNSRVEMVFGK